MTATEIIAIVSGIIGCATAVISSTPCVRQPLEECYGYLKNSEDKLRTLEKQEAKLQKLIQIKLRSGLEAAEDRWMQDAYKTLDMIRDCCNVETGSLLCWCTCLADYRRRYLVGKNISRIKERVNELTNEFQRNRGINTVDRQYQQGELTRICRSTLVGRDITEVIQQIISNAVDNDIRYYNQGAVVLGVCGASGVGKTEAVAHVYNRILNQYRSHFNTFIWVEASYEDDLKELQIKIARKIDFVLSSDESVRDNAILLENALQTLLETGKILLILDNMRKAFSLEEIGIPTLSNSLRIIITSPSSSLCRQMKCRERFALNLLTDEEAYLLLINEVGLAGKVLEGEIEFGLKNIAKKCGGLPLAIITFAKHHLKFIGFDFISWKRALMSELDAFSSLKYIEEEVFRDLKLGYEQLNKYSSYGCNTRECLLYCAMYPRNHAFVAEELMKDWMTEGLLGEEMEGIDERFGKAKEILEELKDASFLVGIISDENEIVKMHPLMFDMASKMEKKTPWFFKPGRRLRKFVYEDWSGDVERVSLMGNNLRELRTCPMFCKLTTLFLQGNPLDLQLDNDFFNSFPNLKILNLSDTSMGILPKSLSSLKYLTVLLLQNCIYLTCLPSLAELVELMVLDVSGSGIAEFPDGMNHLTKLLFLNLSRTRVRNFPLHLVTSLHNLQEFSMIGCDLLCLPRSLMQEDYAAFIEDVRKLRNLNVFDFTFVSLQSFKEYISSQHWLWLQSYKFSVGALGKGKLRGNTLAFMKEFPNDPMWLPWNTSELLLVHCNAVTQMTIPNLQNLKFLEIFNCEGLKYLFKYGVWCCLRNLEELVIANCRNLEKVIEQDDDENSNPQVCWRSLRKLILSNLPELRFMYSGEAQCDFVQTIGIWSCCKLERFPISLWVENYAQKLKSPCSLKEVSGDRSWLRILQHCPPNAAQILWQLFSEQSPPEELISWYASYTIYSAD